MIKSFVKSSILYFMFSIGFIPYLKSNNIDYYFSQISIEQGLSQNTVNSILLDYKGVLWIGTNSGLNSFNRNEINTYLHEKNNKFSIPGNTIYFIAEDSLYNLWVSTDKGLVLYDRINKRFNSAEPTKNLLAYSYILLNDGILFSTKGTFYKYIYKTSQLKEIPIKNLSGSPVRFNKMSLLDKNNLLATSKDYGVWFYNLQTHLIRPWHTSTNKIMASFADTNGRLYLSYYKEGLYCFSANGKELFHLTTANSNLTNNIILDITYHNNKLWLGTDGGGISILDPSNPRQITNLQHRPGDSGSLPNNSIKVLYTDMNQNIWAGTVRGGMFGIHEVPIRTYKDVPLLNTKGLSEKVVISLFEDQNGILWIGTDGGGINQYNPSSDRFLHYPTTYGEKIVSVTDYSPNELLISIYEKGLFIFNKKSGKCTPFTLINRKINTQECFMDYVPLANRISEDKICILSHNLYVYNTKLKSFSIIHTKENPDHLSALRLIYSNNRYIYLMGQNRIFEVDEKTNTLRTLFSMDPKETINAACSDGNGKFWIGTDWGLACYDSRTHQLHHIETKLFTNITTLFLDHQDRLWISAQNMLFSYLISKNKFVVWGESDGFTANELLFAPVLSTHTPNIYIGGISGLVKINSKATCNSYKQPQIELSDLLVDGNSHLNQIDFKKPSIVVPWNYNSLIAKVLLREPDVFRKVLFRYSIIELNKKGIDTYSSSIDLSNLSPGKYTIMISCNTKSGNWSLPTHLLTITVTPPWYKRPWIIGLFIILVVAFALTIVRMIIKKKENRLKWKMKEHEQKTYEEKIRFLINVSHEFRTSLTLIYAPLKRLLESMTTTTKPNEEYQQKVLTSIYKQTKEMKNTIDMILDINRINDAEEKLQKKMYPLNEWIQSVAEDFRLELESKEIQLTYQLDNSIDQVCFDGNKCKVVLSNYLINALKFSFPHTTIIISTSIRDGYVRIAVTDQGSGLSNVNIDKLFTRFYQGEHERSGNGIGLSYAKMLVEIHNGHIGAYNNADQGATFYYELPLYSNESEISKNVIDLYSGEHYLQDTSNNEQNSFETSHYSIIVVEDNVELHQFLKEELKDAFKKVYIASDGLEALQLIKQKLPDIIVSDVMMPRMDGYELCKRVKETLEISHIPVVLLTVRSDSNSTSVGYKLGADVYLTKPFEIDTLLNVIKNQLKTREQLKEIIQEGRITNLLIDKLTTNNVDEKFLKTLNALIKDNLDNPQLDVDFLVKSMAISRTPLYGKVKALTGIGVNDYINSFRIIRAEELLLSTDMSVTEISEACGFTYQRYFSSIFKKSKGITPSQFRNEHQKEQTDKNT